MSEVTRLLDEAAGGDHRSTDRLMEVLYDELRQLALAKLRHEQPGQTIQATGLVHEAFLRLCGGQAEMHWDSRGHFFAAAAEAMRRILINRARDKGRAKRGGELRRIEFTNLDLADSMPVGDIVALNDALDQLAMIDPQAAHLVNLRFFAGLSLRETALAMEISQRTADRQWAYARAWLHSEIRKGLST